MDKGKLLAKREQSYRDVEVDVGTVRVRGLTRAEVKGCKDGDETNDLKIIAAGMVDPELTEAEVAQWLDNAPAGDYVAVLNAISELSGLSKEVANRGLPGDR